MTEPPGLASALASRLRALWGPEVEVVGARPLPGGASRESWDVQVRAPGGPERRLILLRDADGQARNPDKNVAVAVTRAGPGLALHQGLAVRLGEPRRRVRCPRRLDGGLRRRRRHSAG